MARNQRLYMQQLIPHRLLVQQLNEWGRKGWALVSLTPPKQVPVPHTTLQGPCWMAIFENETLPEEEAHQLSEEIRGLEAAGLIRPTGLVDQR